MPQATVPDHWTAGSGERAELQQAEQQPYGAVAAARCLRLRRGEQEPAVSPLSDERSAINESAFRNANEQLKRRRLEILGDDDGETAFLCECDDVGCTKILLLSLEEYEAARASPRRFVVAPEHKEPSEAIVVEEGRFWLIEKTGVAARVAEDEARRPREDAVNE